MTGLLGMVTANHRLAAAAGAEILRQGGNAVDAAVATSFALGVVEPAASGIGGRGYMVIHLGGRGHSLAIDGHERAPLAASADMFPLAAGDAVPTAGWGPQTRVVGDRNAVGHQAVAVPGLVAALAAAHRRHGRLPWPVLLRPAIALAEDGFDVTTALAQSIAANRDKLARSPVTAFLPGDQPLAAGERLLQPELARSYRLIAEGGATTFYRGPIARTIVAEVARGGGVLSADDLARYAPRLWRAPLLGTYRGFRLLTLPEATGGVTLIEIMNLLEAHDLGAMPPLDPATLHALLQSFRLAFQDRYAYVDDPAFGPVPFAGLAAKAYAAARRRLLDERRATPLGPGDPWPFDAADGAEQPAVATPAEWGADANTTHCCVVDRRGMVVSLTQSIVDAFGSGVVVPGTGIVLNSAMHNFNPVPGRRGSIAPWKRSAHHAAPIIVLRPDGQPAMALGGAGGTKIITGVAQVLVGVLDRERDIQEAIAAPRVHNEGWDSQVDQRIPADVRAALQRMGHRLETLDGAPGRSGFGRLNGIAIGPSGELAGGVEPFGDGGLAMVGGEDRC